MLFKGGFMFELPKIYYKVVFFIHTARPIVLKYALLYDDELILWYDWPTKTNYIISNRDNCQRSSPSRISDTPRAEFESAQNLLN